MTDPASTAVPVPASAPRIVVLGSTNMDLVATAPALPRPGETVLGYAFAQVPGGKGANQAIAAARAGGATTLLGAIGSDTFGVILRSRLAKSTVDISQLRVLYGASGVALILVDDDGENVVVVVPGANAAMTNLTGGELAAIAAADVLLCQLEIPLETVLAGAAAARAAQTRVILNAAPARLLPAELLGLVDLLVLNEVEAADLVTSTHGRLDLGVDSGDQSEIDVLALLDALLEAVPRAVVTRGAAGAWYGDRESGASHVPAPVIGVVDTTGAGDAFAAALAVAWGEGRPVPDAVRWASAAGACAVRQLGASTGMPDRAAIDELYRATYPG